MPSGGLRLGATTSVRATYIEEFAATVAGGRFRNRNELATQAVTNGVFVNVRWQERTFCVFDVVDPLVVYLGVPEFIDAFDVVGGSLVDLLLV